MTFSGMKKPKAKILVGAAFFSTAKKPSSMYKKMSTAKGKAAVKADKSTSQPDRNLTQKNPTKVTM